LVVCTPKTWSPNRFPEKGRRVILRNNANLSTGGSATDVTDDVHPEVASRVVEAAQMVGLDICGVDVVCESVLRPLKSKTAASSKSTLPRVCACTSARPMAKAVTWAMP
jgi:hypothetical protein